MTCSPARIEANRRNAAKSTGPRTEGGKARSRLNAFRHGLAGAGDLLGPAEDAREVDGRAAEIAEEAGARGRTGRILAHRVAALSLRLERAEEHALVASAARAQAARDEFDRERAGELDDLIAELGAADDPKPLLAELEGSPEGVRFLAESWAEIIRELRAGGDDGRARRWLGADVADAPPIERAEAELARLRRLAVELDGTAARAIAAARHQAGVLASFDASVEGERARRHEAAAERAMHKALRALAEPRAAAAEHPAPALAPPPLRGPVPSRPAPAPPIVAPPRVAPNAMGSFRIEEAAGLGSFRVDGFEDLFGRPGTPAAAPGSIEARRRRPDPARLAGARR